MSIDKIIVKTQERIDYCDERILFWNSCPETKQVWIGIKAELERLLKFILSDVKQ